jgi:hypothetical protein
MSQKKRRFLRRVGRNSQHHDLAKVRGGTRSKFNLYNLDDNRHAAFHLLFGVRTFLEAAAVLIRADKMRRSYYKVAPAEVSDENYNRSLREVLEGVKTQRMGVSKRGRHHVFTKPLWRIDVRHPNLSGVPRR